MLHLETSRALLHFLQRTLHFLSYCIQLFKEQEGFHPYQLMVMKLKGSFFQLLELFKPPYKPYLYPVFTNMVQIFKKNHLRSVEQQDGAVHQTDKNYTLSMEPMADVEIRIEVFQSALAEGHAITFSRQGAVVWGKVEEVSCTEVHACTLPKEEELTSSETWIFLVM